MQCYCCEPVKKLGIELAGVGRANLQGLGAIHETDLPELCVGAPINIWGTSLASEISLQYKVLGALIYGRSADFASLA